MTKRTSVLLDPRIALMAEEKHKRLFHQDMNFSDFFRHCLEAWVYSADDPRPIWQQASDIVEQMKKEAIAQKSLVQYASQQEQERAAAEKVRNDLIDTATRREIERITPDRFRRYLDDPHGDFHGVLEDVVSAVGKESGCPVELHDVIAAYKRVVS